MTWWKAAKMLWALPCTALGLVLAAIPLALGGRAKWAKGALEIAWRPAPADCGRLASRLPFRAIVFGHVILGLTAEDLRRAGPHERVHVAQYERWGVLFFPAYLGSSFWQLLRGRDPYWHNRFEVEARERSAGR